MNSLSLTKKIVLGLIFSLSGLSSSAKNNECIIQADTFESQSLGSFSDVDDCIASNSFGTENSLSNLHSYINRICKDQSDDEQINVSIFIRPREERLFLSELFEEPAELVEPQAVSFVVQCLYHK